MSNARGWKKQNRGRRDNLVLHRYVVNFVAYARDMPIVPRRPIDNLVGVGLLRVDSHRHLRQNGQDLHVVHHVRDERRVVALEDSADNVLNLGVKKVVKGVPAHQSEEDPERVGIHERRECLCPAGSEKHAQHLDNPETHLTQRRAQHAVTHLHLALDILNLFQQRHKLGNPSHEQVLDRRHHRETRLHLPLRLLAGQSGRRARQHAVANRPRRAVHSAHAAPPRVKDREHDGERDDQHRVRRPEQRYVPVRGRAMILAVRF